MSTLLFLALPAAVLGADPSLDLAEEADLQFELGVAAYRNRDYLAALEHLLLSNRLVPNRNVVFNIARAYEQLGRYPEAWRHYRDYLDVESDPPKRAGAEEAVARIRPHVALLRVDSDPPGASIFLDRVDLGVRGVTPRELAVEAGVHSVILRQDKFHEASRSGVRVEVGQQVPVSLSMDAILGSVDLEGRPSGAEVRVDEEDGAPVGLLPGELRLPPGPHMLIVSAPGYRTARQLVQVGEEGRVRAVVELPLVTGSVVVDAIEKGALIEIDGEPAGFTPAVLPTVQAGAHRVRVSLPGYVAWETTLVVEPDGRQGLTAVLRPSQEVTAASRTTQAVEDAPASVTLIGAQEIRAFGYATLADALGGARGIFTTNDRIYEYVGVRGFARPGDYNNRILLTLDGHALNDDQVGASYVGYDFAPDLADVERIELVRGPGSALYGSNAFFGVVNVVTREGESTPPHLGAGVEGAGTARARAGASGKLGDGGWWASVGGAVSQGEDFVFEELAADGGGVSEGADGFAAAGLRGRLWAGDFSATVYGNYRDKRIPTGAFETLLADERAHSADGRAFVEARFEPEILASTQLFTRAYLDRYDFAGAYPYPGDLVEDRWEGSWAGAEARVVSGPLAWLRLTGGLAGDAHLAARLTGRDEAGVYLSESPSTQTAAVYAVTEADAGRTLTASVGARLDWISSVGATVNPRVALILRPAPGQTLKLLAGRAFRAASPYELYYNDDGVTQIAAAELSPETVLSGEAEYTCRFHDVGSFVLSAYYNRIDGLIDLVDVGDVVLQYRNSEVPVQTLGGEAELRRDWRGGWMASVGVGYQHTRTGESFDGDELTNSPALLGSVKGAAPLLPGQVNAASRLRVESGRLQVDGERTDAVVLADLMLTGSAPAFRLDWALGVKNVLDWRYAHPSGDDVAMTALPQPGRTAYVDVSVGF